MNFPFILASVYCIGLGLWLMQQAKVMGLPDPFHPLRITAVLLPLLSSCYLFLVGTGIASNPDKDLLAPYFPYHDVVRALIPFCALLTVGLMGYAYGVKVAFRSGLPDNAWVAVDKKTASSIFPGLVCLAIGMGVYVYFINDIGGLGLLLSSTMKRGELMQGKGYITIGILFLQLGEVLLFNAFITKRSWLTGVPAAMGMLLDGLAFSSLGGRANLLRLMVICMVLFHFRVRWFTTKDLKWAALAMAIITPYFVGMRVVRSQTEGFASISHDPSKMLGLIGDDAGDSLAEISYAPTYLLIADAFHPYNLLWGESFLDLPRAFTFRSSNSQKPPIDDGVYYTTLARTGHMPEIGTSYKGLYQSSMPPETLGNGFSNFWFPGAWAFMAVLGWMHQRLYSWLQASRFSTFSTMIFVLALVQFQFSNLRIIQFGFTIVALGLGLSPVTKFFRMKKSYASDTELDRPLAQRRATRPAL